MSCSCLHFSQLCLNLPFFVLFCGKGFKCSCLLGTSKSCGLWLWGGLHYHQLREKIIVIFTPMYGHYYGNAPSVKINDPLSQMTCKLLRQLNLFPSFVVQFMRYLVWKIWSFKACAILPCVPLCLTSGSRVSLPTQVQGLMRSSWVERVMIQGYRLRINIQMSGWNEESAACFFLPLPWMFCIVVVFWVKEPYDTQRQMLLWAKVNIRWQFGS
jgi:hypothetical protein